MTILKPMLTDKTTIAQLGLGTSYEYYIKKIHLNILAQKYNLNSILKITYNNRYLENIYYDGIDFIVFKSKDIYQDEKVLLQHDVYQRWINDNVLIGEPLRLPFNSNMFDLVYNFDDITSKEPYRYITEMARVSKDLVLIFAPNRYHIGDIIYRAYVNKIHPAITSHINSTTIETLCGYLQRNNLHIIAKGGIDMPFWPSHLSIGSARGRGRKVNSLKLIYYQALIERKMPEWIKAFQAHIVYALGTKKKSLKNIETN